MGMDKDKPRSRRELKRAVRAVLETEDFESELGRLLDPPDALVCSLLIAHIQSPDGELKRRAVRAIGTATARLADRDMRAAREILRRLNWSLTEEAGSIGWGAPEAIGEILARNEALASEFAPILLSYIGDENLLDHPPLLQGALRGIERLARSHPALVAKHRAAEMLTPYLEDPDPETRRLAREALDRLAIA
jgi:hypothetical protein